MLEKLKLPLGALLILDGLCMYDVLDYLTPCYEQGPADTKTGDAGSRGVILRQRSSSGYEDALR